MALSSLPDSIRPAWREAAQARRASYLETLQALVESESPTRNRAATDSTAALLKTMLEQRGWQVSSAPRNPLQDAEDLGDHIIARWPAEGDDNTLLLAHYDTVWPVGTLETMPYTLEDDRAYGPGSLDMKAGITASIEALALIQAEQARLRGPVTLLISSDEEIGSISSRVLIEDLAKQHQRVLVVEPGRDDGALKVGRKGTAMFRARFQGVSAHAGNNPEDGASALRELAHFLLYAENLQDSSKQTSVNLTVAQGGSVSNVIAENAQASLDMRVLDVAEAERVDSALRHYQPQDKRVSLQLEGGLNRPPLALTPANQALFEEANALGAAMNLHWEGAIVGGGSDGNFTSALGIPTLDGLGSVGQGPHARHEHIRIRDSLDRLALLAALLVG